MQDQDQTKPRTRVLLIAEQANPEWVSVPLVGWSHCAAIAQVADAHIVTQIRNRDAFVRAGLIEGRDFTAIDSEAAASRTNKISSLLRGGSNRGWTLNTALESLSYRYFERLLWQQLGQRIRSGEWEIVHRVTPLTPTASSSIARKCHKAGVPFVLGPLNGGLPWPKGFDATRRREKEWLSYVRSAHKLLPGYRATRKHATAIMIASSATWEQLPATYRHKAAYQPENAIDPALFPSRTDRPTNRPIKVAFLGRLVPYKGADMLLRAAAPLIREQELTVDIIGDGPEMPSLKAIAVEEGIQEHVTLAGHIDHHELKDRLTQSDILGFPSIREFGGGVVLEAMALGLVPLIVDYGGPTELVTEDTGFKVPLGTREQIIEGLRERLQWITNNPAAIQPMGQRCRDRVLQHYTWTAKAQQTLKVYDWVLGKSDRPDFGMPLGEGKAHAVLPG